MNTENPKSPRHRPPTIHWVGGVSGHLEILDQRKLPTEVVVLKLTTTEEVWQAIRTLAIRGAPAIGIAAAYGIFLAARTVSPASQSAALIDVIQTSGAYILTSRPTAVNLEWSIDQMTRIAITERGIGVRQLVKRLLSEANAICTEDAEKCLAIGKHGQHFIPEDGGVLTHCNAGGLATSDHGTALALVYEAHRRGRKFQVFADETRPLLQGARLTAWELQAAGVDVTLICDSMAALVMQQKKIDVILVGADRIAANGDTANKIGTYGVAQLAHIHKIPLIVVAPCSTFDLTLPTGEQIPIEQRPAEEVTSLFGTRTAPPDIKVYNPAFDVTPHKLIHAIVTERGVISPVTSENVRTHVDQ